MGKGCFCDNCGKELFYKDKPISVSSGYEGDGGIEICYETLIEDGMFCNIRELNEFLEKKIKEKKLENMWQMWKQDNRDDFNWPDKPHRDWPL